MTDRLTYHEAVVALTERGRFGISLGLERVERLMAELDHPERGLRGALVGGTNGKGSVVAMTRSVLGAAGLSVGTMPKPHLVSYRERIAIDGEPVGADAFAAAVGRVLPAIDRVAAAIGPPTEFEALTAAAITELARRRVDLAIVEVGMGGRLDATNVLDLGVAAITNVQHDHEAHLGRTLAAIATEKAPIIKPGNQAVTGASGRGLRPIVDRCTALDVPLRRAGPRAAYRATVRATTWEGIVVDAVTPAGRLDGVQIGLLGRHQAANAAVALALLDALIERWGIRRRRRKRCVRGWPPRAGPAASRSLTARRSASHGCCSTGRTTRPVRRPSPSPSAISACVTRRSSSARCAASASTACCVRWPRSSRDSSSPGWTTRARICRRHWPEHGAASPAGVPGWRQRRRRRWKPPLGSGRTRWSWPAPSISSARCAA